ncbi:hypothetical protein BDY24DRAFT_115866 [Mrakia frigida]|uniref:cyclin family protein n=1 Tax=Mrakia frigida TaxID=29902 RepID=UPI003FCBFF06
MSPTLHRINIDQWRSSVPSTSESLTVPPLVGGRFPAHARPLPPPNPNDFNNLTLHHSSSSTSNRPSLLNLTSSTSDEEVESRSGSEMVSERSGKKEEADRLVDSTLELLLSVWPSAPSSLAALTPPVSTTTTTTCSSDSGTSSSSDSDHDAVPLRTFVNEILRRSRSSCATLRAARLYLERAATLLPPGQERKSTLACPRRTFLSSLILANKFLHDRVYSNRAWGKVSGLQVREISQGETALGDLLGWALWVGREPGTFNAAVDLELAANAPPLIPIGPVRHSSSSSSSSSSPSSVMPIQRLKRGRSSSSNNVFPSLRLVPSSRADNLSSTSTTTSSSSSWSRTNSLPSITLNGGGGIFPCSPALPSLDLDSNNIPASRSRWWRGPPSWRKRWDWLGLWGWERWSTLVSRLGRSFELVRSRRSSFVSFSFSSFSFLC